MSGLTTEEVAIWNRATMGNACVSPRAGDTALRALLLVHGLVMNGGVLHAVRSATTAELRSALDAYRFFGLEVVAVLLEQAINVPAEARARLEPALDQEYAVAIPDDDVLLARFKEHFASHREQYAPIGNASDQK